MNKLEGKYLKLHKIEDLKFGGNHPNNINVGYTLKGWCVDAPEVGHQLFLYMTTTIKTTPNSWTSKVMNIDLENMLIQTKNSLYSVEIVEDAKDFTLEELQDSFRNVQEYKLKE